MPGLEIFSSFSTIEYSTFQDLQKEISNKLMVSRSEIIQSSLKTPTRYSQQTSTVDQSICRQHLRTQSDHPTHHHSLIQPIVADQYSCSKVQSASCCSNEDTLSSSSEKVSYTRSTESVSGPTTSSLSNPSNESPTRGKNFVLVQPSYIASKDKGIQLFSSFQTTSTYSEQGNWRKKNTVFVEKEDLLRVIHLPQTQASMILGCSLSTLKRRFYDLKDELQLEKWPQFYHEIRHLPIFTKVYPMSLRFVLNEKNRDEKSMTEKELDDLSVVFKKNGPGNRKNRVSTKNIQKPMFARFSGLCKM